MPKERVRGECGLCAAKKPLQKSHLLPSAIYRTFLAADQTDPIYVKGGQYWRTSKQVRTHFLCSECEERFNTRGERRVIREILTRGGSFPLLNKVKSLGNSLGQVRHGLAYPSGALGPLTPALTYFAASVFWRATATEWPGYGRLGLPTFAQNRLRTFLLGLSSFPSQMVLNVSVADTLDPMYIQACLPRYGDKQGSCWTSSFLIPGIRFDLFVSLFLSYSHKDVKAVDELKASLKVMERNGLIQPWYDRELVAGQLWERKSFSN